MNNPMDDLNSIYSFIIFSFYTCEVNGCNCSAKGVPGGVTDTPTFAGSGGTIISSNGHTEFCVVTLHLKHLTSNRNEIYLKKHGKNLKIYIIYVCVKLLNPSGKNRRL
jgi:hypothetical protein